MECVCQRGEMGPIESFGKIKKSQSLWCEKRKERFAKNSENNGNEDGHGRWRKLTGTWK